MLLGKISGVDLNTLGDNAISLANPGSGNFVVTGWAFSNASAAPVSARVGFFNQAGGAHQIGVNSSLVGAMGLSAPSKAFAAENGGAQDILSGSPTLYARVVLANGAACTCDIAVFGEPI